MAYVDEKTGEIIEMKFRTISDLKGFNDNEKQTKKSAASQNYVGLSEQVHALLKLGSPALRLDESDYDLDLSKMTVEEALDAYTDPTEELGFDLVDVPAIMEALQVAIAAEKANAAEKADTSKKPINGATEAQSSLGTNVPDASFDDISEPTLV